MLRRKLQMAVVLGWMISLVLAVQSAQASPMSNGQLVGKPRLTIHTSPGSTLGHQLRTPVPRGAVRLTATFQIRPTQKPKGGWPLAHWNSSLARTVERHVSMTVPAGVAKMFVDAAGRNLKDARISTSNTRNGLQVRLVAGKGKKAVVIDRTHYSGTNGEAGLYCGGIVRVQKGVGPKAKAFFVGRTSVTELDPKRFEVTGRSSVFRNGRSKAVDPKTLKPTSTISFSPKVAKTRGGALSWLMRPTRKVTTDLDKGLTSGTTKLPWTVNNMAFEGHQP